MLIFCGGADVHHHQHAEDERLKESGKDIEVDREDRWDAHLQNGNLAEHAAQHARELREDHTRIMQKSDKVEWLVLMPFSIMQKRPAWNI